MIITLYTVHLYKRIFIIMTVWLFIYLFYFFTDQKIARPIIHIHFNLRRADHDVTVIFTVTLIKNEASGYCPDLHFIIKASHANRRRYKEDTRVLSRCLVFSQGKVFWAPGSIFFTLRAAKLAGQKHGHTTCQRQREIKAVSISNTLNYVIT